MGRGARRFVEDLLNGRRPRPFAAAPQDVDELRAAITLRAAAPGADAPSGQFVADLHRRLAAASAAADQPLPDGGRMASAEGRPRATHERPAGSRRRFVWATSVAAAAAAVGGAVGAGFDRLLSSGGSQPADTASDRALKPNTGTWWTVATSRDLPEGGMRAFDLGTVIGFVRRIDGQVRAVSGVCTHQGCRLELDAPVRQLNCPCHRTVFTVGGEVVRSQLRTPPRPLPEIEVREVSGVVQIYAPPRSV
jgi:nitrite reductase/ring-hydroxylating ferredoxin subunit